ncbi:hypothetical protein [Lentzea sp. NPDC059081]|uniref:hypothetical protein n=1 Tax=Lentzea sp. NPDC059081 TaxID=3346719 RepID=UPI003688849A
MADEPDDLDHSPAGDADLTGFVFDAATPGGHPAVIDYSGGAQRVRTYGELGRSIHGLAVLLRDKGVRDGDRRPRPCSGR